MTTVTAGKRYGAYNVRIEGHAGFADPGQDIVCAGISTLAFTLLHALEDMKVHADVEMDQPAGRMCFSFPANKRTEPVLQTVMSGFQMLQHEYPKNIQVGWAK